MADGWDTFDVAWRSGLRPELQMSVSSWADAHRFLPSASAEPGPWSTDRVPYMREIMDCLSTGSPFERVVFQKGAQLGGTEAGLNWIGYIIHQAPGVALLVMPSIDVVRRNTRTRIDPLIQSSPVLAERVVAPRSRDPGNTATSKRFIGGELVMTGANAASALRSTPARYLFLDEVDGYPSDVEGEGDPVSLAVKRTATFAGKRKIFMVSTPTIRDFSRIEAAYLESDQRRYQVPCPHCGAMQTIEWARIKWPSGEPLKAYLECAHCGDPIGEHHKAAMLRAGEWIATGQGDGRTAGFLLSSLYSPFETWGEIAVEFLASRRDVSRLKTWTNTALAETWDDGQTRLEPESLAARAENWGDALPDGIAVITAGVDVQDDRLEVELVGWGAGEESWSLDYIVIPGSPADAATWETLDGILGRRYTPPRNAPALSVRACCIDSGGHYTPTVLEFCAARSARRVWAIKGASGAGRPAWPRRPSRAKKGGQPLFVIGVDGIKDVFYSRLAIDTAGEGYVHFPTGREGEWLSQLTAERLHARWHKGRQIREWRKRAQDRNEALDCRVYAMAALEGLKSLGLRLNDEARLLLDAPLRGPSDPITSESPTAQQKRSVITSRWMSGH
ncbi:MAG: terminase [Hyphomonas sp.]|uniref:phage terminase large subunit family protein n=1 Tax=Hyphomonas sp. TaxID=87 RepID=UPI001D9A1670|nr:phage terminase large subunit family protein [Hyphomonas sp.]MBA4225688.1 terminase [Hyphomonas sp.]